MQTTTLRNGIEIPLEGFGVFQVPDATLWLSAYRYGFGLSE